MADINQHWGEHPKDVDNPKWLPLLVDANGIKVMWSNQIGVEKQQECIGIWSSKDSKQYMLTWKDRRKIILQRSNVTDIVYYKLEEKK